MIKIISGKGRHPFLENAFEPPSLDISRDHIVVHVRKAVAREGGITHEVRIVEDKRTFNAHLEAQSILLKIPRVEAT